MHKKPASDILKGPFNFNLLEQLECFQTRFIKVDNLMVSLRHELAEIDKLPITGIPEEHSTFINMRTKLITLRNVVTDAAR